MLLKQPLAKFAGVRVFARKACTNAARGATEYEASRIQVRLLPPSHSTCVAWSLVGTEAVNQAGSLAGGRVANTPQRQALVKRQVVPHLAPGQVLPATRSSRTSAETHSMPASRFTVSLLRKHVGDRHGSCLVHGMTSVCT